MRFSLKPKNKRSAVSPVIATLLLIAIAVAAAIIVYAFVTGLIGGLTAGGASNLVAATASLAVPSGSGAGTLVITVSNNANSPITAITVSYNGMEDSAFAAVTCMGQVPSDAGCGGLAGPVTVAQCGTSNAGTAIKPVPFCYSPLGVTTLIGLNAGLPVGSETSASDNVVTSTATPLQSGSTYSMVLTVDFANGGTHTQVISATAAL